MNDAEGIAEVMKKYDYSLYADGCTDMEDIKM